MGYPILGKARVIVLVSLIEEDDEEGMTVAQYKEKFGIDLSDFIKIDDVGIYFEPKPTDFILVTDRNSRASERYALGLMPATYRHITANENLKQFSIGYHYEEGDYNGITLEVPTASTNIDDVIVKPLVF